MSYRSELIRKQAFQLTPHEQYRLAFFIAENVGYVLARGPEHPDSPHNSSEHSDRLHDALQQLVDWVKDGCSDEMRTYCMTEAQAALKGLSITSGIRKCK